KPISGHGNSNQLNSYSYKDESAFGGAVTKENQTIYYRIKQMDYDGHSDYSRIAEVSSKRAFIDKSILFPNPANNLIMIISNSNFSRLVLMDMMGRAFELIQTESNMFDVSN